MFGSGHILHSCKSSLGRFHFNILEALNFTHLTVYDCCIISRHVTAFYHFSSRVISSFFSSPLMPAHVKSCHLLIPYLISYHVISSPLISHLTFKQSSRRWLWCPDGSISNHSPAPRSVRYNAHRAGEIILKRPVHSLKLSVKDILYVVFFL